MEVVIYFSFVVTAIRSKTLEGLFDLFQQRHNHLAIADAVGGQSRGLNFTAMWIKAHMQFAPGTPFRFAVGTHFPFTFSKDFQTSAVHTAPAVGAGVTISSSPLVVLGSLTFKSLPRRDKVVWSGTSKIIWSMAKIDLTNPSVPRFGK